MPQITIRESRREGGGAEGEGGFRAVLCLDDGVEYSIDIADPFGEQEEERLGWYFEEHLRRPFLNGVKASEAARSIASYGQHLFKQVFEAHAKAYARYFQARSRLGELDIEIEGSPAFHALHWEALKDPDLPRAFALDTALVRRRRAEQPIEAQIKPAPTLRLLIVTARPHGASDVAYRTISRPLVECLRQAGVLVDIDILRPGTYRALDNHLQDVLQRRGSGFYHLIHFDTHGALLTFAELQAGSQPGGLAFRRYGRGALAPYDGQKAFLFLEDEAGAEADPVEASELAKLLTVHQIPIAILNACQSGKQVGVTETSLGSHLIEAGVQMVLAMSYSITVSAAEVFMTTLYQRLFAGEEVATAIRRARQALHNQKTRRAYFNHTVELEDWLLPVAYQNQPVKLTRRAFTPEEEKSYYERQAAAFAEPATAYGFFGRDLDVLAIERRLLRHNLLLVRGMGGAGKTTLLRHLGHWWQTTDFVAEVFYFGYDEQGWTRQQIMSAIARRLWGEADYHARFVPLSPAAQQMKLAEELRGKRHLLILDNLESITGTHLAIAHGLAQEEQAALAEFLKSLKAGKSLVLLGSRAGEAWLAKGTFEDNVHELAGLDPEAASLLAEHILERHGATQYRDDEELTHLLKLLAGFPLALEVVLPNLAQQTPAAVLAALQQGTELESGSTESKTESILRCIEYSHSNLSPEAQHLLACLAPFSGVLNTQLLPQYSEQLKAQPLLAELPFGRWGEVLKEATDWGLMSPHPQLEGLLRLQPVFPYFLKHRLTESDQLERRRAVEAAFRQHYDGYANAMVDWMKSKDAEEKQWGQLLAGVEYENLLAALELALAAQASISRPYSALSAYVDATHDEARGLALGQLVLGRVEGYPAQVLSGTLGAELAGVLDTIGKRQLLLKRLDEAEASYHRALELWLGNTALEPARIRRGSASIYHRLGIVAQEQRQWPQAEQYYQQALAICIEFNDRYEQAPTYHQLGTVALEQRQWPQAEQYYQQALVIKIEFNDRYSQAGTYHQLGRVAAEQRQWPQAEQYYQQALAIFIEFNDRHSQALTYHQLGRVAAEQRQWPQAEQYYQQALAIDIEFQDEHSLPIVLGSVARLWQASSDASLPARLAELIGESVENVEGLLKQYLTA